MFVAGTVESGTAASPVSKLAQVRKIRNPASQRGRHAEIDVFVPFALRAVNQRSDDALRPKNTLAHNAGLPFT